MAKQHIVDSTTGMTLVLEQPVRDFLVAQLEAEIKRLREALRLIADPGDITTPEELGYIAAKALGECDHLWGTRQGGFLVHCGKCGAIKPMKE